MSAGATLQPLATVQLARLLEIEPRTVLQRGQGRETFEAELDGVVRIVKRTQETPRLWAAPSTAAREARALAALAAAGFAVPRVLGWMEERFAPLAARRSVLVLERIEHAQTLEQSIARAGFAARLLWPGRAVELLARLHVAGWQQRDCRAQDYVVRGDELLLADAGRIRPARRPFERRRLGEFAGLLASLRLTRSDRLRLVQRYLDVRGVHDPVARRRWSALALARSARSVPRGSGEGR